MNTVHENYNMTSDKKNDKNQTRIIKKINIFEQIRRRNSIFGKVNSLQMKNIYIFVASKGGLAQLARAFDWQSKGHRFDSDILH